MRTIPESRRILMTAAVAVVIACATTPALAQSLDAAKGEVIGQAEFVKNCAVCHGREGKGDGPLADQLAKRPAPLTTIAKQNKGVFPTDRIYRLIDGREMISAHGTSEMPVWGDRYFAKSVEDHWPWGSEQVVRGRILEIVFYLQSIQER